jgi:hypothetical protein
MQTIVQQIRRAAGDLGPYLLVELLLPGGSLIAVIMWVYRRHRKAA